MPKSNDVDEILFHCRKIEGLTFRSCFSIAVFALALDETRKSGRRRSCTSELLTLNNKLLILNNELISLDNVFLAYFLRLPEHIIAIRFFVRFIWIILLAVAVGCECVDLRHLNVGKPGSL